jgi:hypothetical protein
MDAIKSIIAAVGWLVANAALAQASGGGESIPLRGDLAQDAYLVNDADRTSTLALNGSISSGAESAELVPGPELERASFPAVDYFSAYRMTPVGGVLAKAGVQSFSTSVASIAFIQRHTGIDTGNLLSSHALLGVNPGFAQSFRIGHAWRDLTFEGVTFTSQSESAIDNRPEVRRIDSRSARLSFSPASNWVVRLTRGAVSGLDHLVAGEEVRRTALSATYQYAFAEGDWETTFAWGRNSRKFRESTVGYLAESAFRFDGVHSVFGRIEQVGSDEIARENESMQRQLFMMNKVTLGYSQDLRITSSLRMDAGAYVARHFVPSGMASSYGAGPTAYMLFVRVKLQ